MKNLLPSLSYTNIDPSMTSSSSTFVNNNNTTTRYWQNWCEAHFLSIV